MKMLNDRIRGSRGLRVLFPVAAMLLVCATEQARGTDYYWTNRSGISLMDLEPSCWNPPGIPGPSDRALFLTSSVSYTAMDFMSQMTNDTVLVATNWVPITIFIYTNPSCSYTVSNSFEVVDSDVAIMGGPFRAREVRIHGTNSILRGMTDPYESEFHVGYLPNDNVQAIISFGMLVASNDFHMSSDYASATSRLVISEMSSFGVRNMRVGEKGWADAVASNSTILCTGNLTAGEQQGSFGRLSLYRSSCTVSNDFVVGRDYGATGIVALTSLGNVYQKTPASGFAVGYGGHGELYGTNSTVSAVGTVKIGHEFSGAGWGLVSLTNCTMTTGTNEYLGCGTNGSWGRLVLNNSRHVVSNNTYLGNTVGGTGIVELVNSSSVWTNKGALYVGGSGYGSLTIDGGTLDVGGDFIATNGVNSVLNFARGKLTARGNSRVSTGGALTLGTASGGRFDWYQLGGTDCVVDGVLGLAGMGATGTTGTLTVAQGATLRVNGDVFCGGSPFSSQSRGIATVSNATLAAAGSEYVGMTSAGPGNVGEMTVVSGTNTANSLVVGGYAWGRFVATNSTIVISNGCLLGWSVGMFFGAPADTGIVVVAGTTVWTNGGTFAIGGADGGYGELTINGGSLSVAGLSAANGANSIFQFNNGILNSCSNVVANAAGPLTVGDGVGGADTAVWNIMGGVDDLWKGLLVNSDGRVNFLDGIVNSYSDVVVNASSTLTVGDGAGSANTAVWNIRAGSNNLANGLLVQADGRVNVMTGNGLGANGPVTNAGTIFASNGTYFAGNVVVTGNGKLEAVTNAIWTFKGDFTNASANPAFDTLHATVAFPAGGSHVISLGCDSAYSNTLRGFCNNRAVGCLRADGTVDVTGTVYAWKLSGDGTLNIGAGSRLYYARNTFSGTVNVTGGGIFEQIPVVISNASQIVSSSFQLAWPAGEGLNFAVEWCTDLLVSGGFKAATNLVATGDSMTWIDEGGPDRPPPGQATNRFYRLNVWP